MNLVSPSFHIKHHNTTEGVPVESVLKNCSWEHPNEGLSKYPDNHFDIAIVDPPYGIGFSDYERYGYKGVEHLTGRHEKSDWDEKIPDDEYFKELFRVSKNQIIWGGNYFPLPPTQCFIFWHKKQHLKNFAAGELAWTSFKRPALYADLRYYSSLLGGAKAKWPRIHPTQKPIELYGWQYAQFTEPGMKVLDTHLGSGSNRIAAYYAGVDFTAFETKESYFVDSIKWFETAITEQKLF
jgi:site-specific DNA-methyltransferase (adenine-specific)